VTIREKDIECCEYGPHCFVQYEKKFGAALGGTQNPHFNWLNGWAAIGTYVRGRWFGISKVVNRWSIL
jgi:hypothetical protein